MTDGPLGGPAVQAWLDELRGSLDREAQALVAQHPACSVRVHSYAVGERTDFQGRTVILEVTLEDGEAIALCVTAAYLTTLPRLAADVSWSHGNIEAVTWDSDSSSEWPLATAEHIGHLDRDLARLLAALRQGIVRGRPRRT